jgi:prephenate dehydrogenase
MGASLALAIKKKELGCEVVGVVRSTKSRAEGISQKIADQIFLEEEFLTSNSWNEYDLIVFSLPVDLTCDKIDLIPENYKGYITDLGSTKKSIIQKVESKFTREHNYYSSHPMAGSEQSGMNYAKVDLYENRLCILTKSKGVSKEAIEKITQFWKMIGSITIQMDANEHDEVLSYLSHTPHILSSILVNWAYKNEKVKFFTQKSPIPITGGGFRDMTRIAGSNPEMWNAIINTNKHSIHDSLLEFRKEIDRLLQSLETTDEKADIEFWKKYFLESRESRSQILKINE